MDTGGLFLKGKAIVKTVHTLYLYAVVIGFSTDYLVVGRLHFLESSFLEGKRETVTRDTGSCFWKGKTIVKAVHTYLLLLQGSHQIILWLVFSTFLSLVFGRER